MNNLNKNELIIEQNRFWKSSQSQQKKKFGIQKCLLNDIEKSKEAIKFTREEKQILKDFNKTLSNQKVPFSL